MTPTKLRLSYHKAMLLYVKVSLELFVALIVLLFSGQGWLLKLGGVTFDLGLFCVVSYIKDKSWEKYGYRMLSKLTEVETIDQPWRILFGGTIWCSVGIYCCVTEFGKISIAYSVALTLSWLVAIVYGMKLPIYGYLDRRDYRRYFQACSELDLDTTAEMSFSKYAVLRSGYSEFAGL